MRETREKRIRWLGEKNKKRGIRGKIGQRKEDEGKENQMGGEKREIGEIRGKIGKRR